MKYYCSECGGTDVYFDAYLHANSGDTITFDDTYCDDCGTSTTLEYR